jgi:hypothetical protein
MSDAPALTLRALRGTPCPGDIVLHASSAAKLTRVAVEHLPQVLDPTITEPMSQALATALTQFSVRYEIAEADLGRTMRACRFLVREACSTDLAVDGFTEDCAALFADAPGLRDLLVQRYEAYKAKLRTQLYLAALEEHGAVLADVTWRVDLVASTSGAAKLAMPVAMLTLRYRENGADQRLTLQVPGDTMKKLRDALDAILE